MMVQTEGDLWRHMREVGAIEDPQEAAKHINTADPQRFAERWPMQRNEIIWHADHTRPLTNDEWFAFHEEFRSHCQESGLTDQIIAAFPDEVAQSLKWALEMHVYGRERHGYVPNTFSAGNLLCRVEDGVSVPLWMEPIYNQIIQSIRSALDDWLQKPTRPDRQFLPFVSDVFEDGRAEMSTSTVFYGLIRSIHNRDWQEGDGGMQYQTWRLPSSNASLTTMLWPPMSSNATGVMPQASDITDEAAARLRAMVTATVEQGGLSSLDGDILTVCVMHALKHRDLKGMTWITTDQILKDLHITPMFKTEHGRRRPSGQRMKDREAVARAMSKLDHFWVRTHNLKRRVAIGDGSSTRPRTRAARSSLEYKALVYEKRETQDVFRADGTVESLPYAWYYKTGDWLADSLAPWRQTALLDFTVLKYDGYHESWEKIVSYYIAWLLRCDAAAGRGRRKVLDIETIFRQCGLRENRSNPAETVKRFERMMARLSEDKAVCSSIEYTPESRSTNQHGLPRKGMLRQWMQLQVEITPLEETVARNRQLAATAERRRLLAGSPKSTGAEAT